MYWNNQGKKVKSIQLLHHTWYLVYAILELGNAVTFYQVKMLMVYSAQATNLIFVGKQQDP